jgi:hypothetical protein
VSKCGDKCRDIYRFDFSAIIKLCARRFIVRNIQQQARAILNFKSDARSVVKSKKKYQEWIQDKRMTEEEAKKDLEPELKEAADGIKTVTFSFFP